MRCSRTPGTSARFRERLSRVPPLTRRGGDRESLPGHESAIVKNGEGVHSRQGRSFARILRIACWNPCCNVTNIADAHPDLQIVPVYDDACRLQSAGGRSFNHRLQWNDGGWRLCYSKCDPIDGPWHKRYSRRRVHDSHAGGRSAFRADARAGIVSEFNPVFLDDAACENFHLEFHRNSIAWGCKDWVR